MTLTNQRSGVVNEAWLATRCPPRCFLLNKDGEKIRKVLQQDEDEVWCLPLLPPHPFVLFQHRVPPAGYSPSHTAPVWAPLHKLHAVLLPENIILWGLLSGGFSPVQGASTCAVMSSGCPMEICSGMVPHRLLGDILLRHGLLCGLQKSLLRFLEDLLPVLLHSRPCCLWACFSPIFSQSPLSELLHSGTLLGASAASGKNTFTLQDKLFYRQLQAQTTLPGGSLHATFLSHIVLKQCLPD